MGGRRRARSAELGWTVAYSLVEDGRVVPRAVYGREDDPVTQYGRSIIGRPLDGPSAPIASQVVATGHAVFLDNLPSTRTEQVKTVAVQLDRSMAEARVRRSVWCPIWIDNAVVAVLAVAGAGLTDHRPRLHRHPAAPGPARGDPAQRTAPGRDRPTRASRSDGRSHRGRRARGAPPGVGAQHRAAIARTPGTPHPSPAARTLTVDSDRAFIIARPSAVLEGLDCRGSAC